MRRFDPESRFRMTIINLLLLVHSLLTFIFFFILSGQSDPLGIICGEITGGEKRMVYIYTACGYVGHMVVGPQ